jgi:hypothetical protein
MLSIMVVGLQHLVHLTTIAKLFPGYTLKFLSKETFAEKLTNA